MLGSLLLTFWILWDAPQSAAINQPAPSDLHATLALRDGKTTFRQGEPVRLVLTYSADRPGYKINAFEGYLAPGRLTISPDSGVFHWQDRYQAVVGRQLTHQFLDEDVPKSGYVTEFSANEWYRFDAPGTYTIQLTTYRVTRGERFRNVQYFETTTNPVTFRIVPMSESDEEVETGRLLAKIRSEATGGKDPGESCAALVFLGGRASAVVLARDLADDAPIVPPSAARDQWCNEFLRIGPYISRFPDMVLSRQEDLLDDTSRPVQYYWLREAIAMRRWINALSQPVGPAIVIGGGLARPIPERDPVAHLYLDRLAESLDRRVGSSLLETAREIVTDVFDLQPPPPAAVRVLLSHFSEFSEQDQRELIEGNWSRLRDPSLVPAVERFAAESPKSPAFLEALIDMSPEEGRKRVVELIGNHDTKFEDWILVRLPDQELRETDDALVSQLEAFVADGQLPPNQRTVSDQTSLLARFATTRILDDVRRIYDANGETLAARPRGYLLAYLIKHDELGSRVRLEKAIAGSADVDDLLWAVTRFAYSSALEQALSARLDSDDARVATLAVRTLGQFAPESARPLLEARLNRWVAQWAPRRQELLADGDDVRAQEGLQEQLIWTLIHGAHTAVGPEQAARLKATCLTSRCREFFHGQ